MLKTKAGVARKNDQMLIAALLLALARQGRIVLHFAVTLILLLHRANYNPDMI